MVLEEVVVRTAFFRRSGAWNIRRTAGRCRASIGTRSCVMPGAIACAGGLGRPERPPQATGLPHYFLSNRRKRAALL